MKFKIKQIGKNTFPKRDGSGDITILTFLTDDSQKVKAWGGKYTLGLKVGDEVDCDTEVKKDREGFDETWLKAPRSKFGGGFQQNLWAPAYQVALQYLTFGKAKVTEESLDKWAKVFYAKFTGNASAETPKAEQKTKAPVPSVEVPADDESDEESLEEPSF